MSSLSDSDRGYVQRKLGIGTDESVFTDAELDDSYTRAGADLTRTILDGWEDLAANQAKLASYANGLQREDVSDVFDHVMRMIDYWTRRVAARGGQAKIVGLRPTPTVHREQPATLADPTLADRLAGRRRE